MNLLKVLTQSWIYSFFFIFFFIISILTLNLDFNYASGLRYYILDKYITNYLTNGVIINHLPVSNYLIGGILQHIINNLSSYISYIILALIFYVIYKDRNLKHELYLYPFILLSFIYGDYITPLGAILLYGVKRGTWLRDIGILLIVFSDPLLLLPYLLLENNEKHNLIRKIILTPILLLGIIINPSYLSLIQASTFTISRFLITFLGIILYAGLRKINIYQLLITLFLTPFTYNSGYALLPSTKNSSSNISLSNSARLFIAILLVGSGIYTTYYIWHDNVSYTPQIYNPSLKKFIWEVIPENATVISATSDIHVNRVLIDRGAFIIPFQDSMTWNWSSRKDIKKMLSSVIDLSYKYNAKYIVLIRGSSLPYWVSPYQYKEYKYGLIYPENTFLVVLENIGLYLNRGPYYIEKVYNSSSTLLPRLFKVWTRDKINYTFKEGLTINSSSPYVIYLSFKLPDNVNKSRNYLILNLNGLNESGHESRINSLEIYGYDGYKLSSLWVRTDISKNLNLILEDLNLTKYPYITLKLDSSGFIRIGEFAIENRSSESPYTYRTDGKTVNIVNNLNSYIELNTIYGQFKKGVGVYKPDEFKSFNLNSNYIPEELEVFLTLTLAFIVISIIFRDDAIIDHEYNSGNILDDINSLFLLPIIPLLYDLIYYPHLLEINWIGDGTIIFSTIMIYMIFYIARGEHDRINERPLSMGRYILLIPLIYLFNQYSIQSILSSLSYLDEWLANSYISLINNVSTLLLYIFILLIAFSVMEIKNDKLVLAGFSIPIIYLGVTSFLYFINVTNNPMEKYLSILPYLNGFLSAKLLGLSGIFAIVKAYPYATIIHIYNGVKALSIAISWPCSGITGLFLYSSFIVIEYIYLRRRKHIELSDKTLLLTYSVGFVTVFLLNILRITIIILLALSFGFQVSDIFHSTGYEILFFIWILIYIYIVEYFIRRVYR